MLSTDQEKKLWVAFYYANDQEARQQLIKAYIPLVKYLAERLRPFTPGTIAQGDLLGYGAIGLIEAVERFNPELNIKFSSFATVRIRGAMLDGIRKTDWLPRNLRKRERTYHETYYKLANNLGRNPNDKEIAQELNISEQELHTILREINQDIVLTVDEEGFEKGQTDGSYHSGCKNLLGDAYGLLLEKEKKSILRDAIEKLPEKEKLVIALYYYEGLTFKEIGLVLDLSESRISQLHSKSILRLRGRLSRRKEELIG